MSAQQRAMSLWFERYRRKYGDTLKALVMREPRSFDAQLEQQLFWSKFAPP